MDAVRGRDRSIRRAVGLVCVGLSCCLGCVERRYTIRTDPPGALVTVNGEEVGPSPVSRSFTYYGDREITVAAEGYQTQRIIQPMPAPWWDNVITDFFTENLLPVTLRDEREYAYRLGPAVSPSTPDLVNQAEQLRTRAKSPPAERRRGLLAWLGFR